MNRSHEARIRLLEQRARASTDPTVFYSWTETGNGTVYHTLNDGRRYTPDAFDRLIRERPDTVFMTLQRSALAEAANKAFWEEEEAKQPTWQDLLDENAEVDRLRESGADPWLARSPRLDRLAEEHAHETDEESGGTDGEDDESWVEDVSLDSDRSVLARYHRWLMARS